MRNIHLLPTDKPSKIGYHFDIVKEGSIDYAPNFGFPLFDTERNFQHRPYNIYITSNEKPNDGDWCFGMDGIFQYKGKVNLPDIELPKKIILTTDADLIADDVQSIEDSFLEWFVNNPTCDFIETKRIEDGKYVDRFPDGSVIEGIYENYKIIIPQEEPKQDKWEQLRGAGLDKPLTNWEEPKQECTCGICDYCEEKESIQIWLNISYIIPQEAPKQECNCGICDYCEEQESIQILKEAKKNALKQESLDEIAEQLSKDFPAVCRESMTDSEIKGWFLEALQKGVKWEKEQQQEQQQQQQKNKYKVCGGCGADNPKDRCINCFHNFE